MEIIAKDEKRAAEQSSSETEKYSKVKDREKVVNKHSLYTQCYVQGVKLILNEMVLRKEQENNDINNIITFMGGRGTGKTTVLREFSDLLKSSNEIGLCNYLEKNGCIIDSRYSQQKIKFTVLPMIDASLLEAGEDPFLLTLASMLDECERYWNNDISVTTFERQEVSRALNEVYRNYLGVQNKETQEDYGESIISKLRSMPSTNKAKIEFDKLLRLFFKIIDRNGMENHFLVVVIDDLDLNIRNGLRMLDQLYKYLNHGQVIVITAVDYKQLNVIAERHFIEDQFKGSQDKQHIEQSKALALDYLDKFLPIAYRIYMPDIIKVAEELEIRTDEEKHFGLKEYVLNKIADKMHIYYDRVGTKRHFAEQDTVRKLMFYSKFLESLNDVTFSECKMIKGVCIQEEKENAISLQNGKMKQYDENHERFNSDIKERMLYEKTTVEQRALFNSLLHRDLGRRARYLIEFKKNWTDDLPLVANIDYREYCYGDILECIYDWGRAVLADKPLLHCIMASFTSEMVREYLNYMYSGKEISRKHSKERLQQFIGTSFMSSWTNEMLPAMDGELRRLEKNIYSDLELSPVIYQYNILLLNWDEKRGDELIEYVIQTILEELAEESWIKILECMDMLLSNCKTGDTGSEHVEYSINIIEGWADAEVIVQYGFKTEKATFDIGGFIIKSIEPVDNQIRFAREIVGKMTNAIIEYLHVKYKESSSYIDTKREEIQRELEKQSMFYNFDKSKDNIAFPFFDLDISYNVIKRVRRKCKDEIKQFKGKRKILDNILRIYHYIENELGRQGEGNGQTKYRDIFRSYPYIVTMKELEANQYFKNYLYTLLNAGVLLQGPESRVDD